MSVRNRFTPLGEVGLLLSIVDQAVIDARRGDEDARRWLAGDAPGMVTVGDVLGHTGLTPDVLERWP